MSEDLKIPPMPEYHDEPVATGMDAEWRHICDLKKWGVAGWSEAQAQARRADEAEARAARRIDILLEQSMFLDDLRQIIGGDRGISLEEVAKTLVSERDALKAENVTQRDEIGRLHHEIEGWKAGKAYAVDEAVRFFNLLLEDSAERDALKARVAGLEKDADARWDELRDEEKEKFRAQEAMAQRDREVLALREGIQKHKDRYIFTNPDHEDYELWKILASTAQAGAEAEHRVLEAAWGRVCFHLRDTGEAANLEHQGIKAAILGTEPNP